MADIGTLRVPETGRLGIGKSTLRIEKIGGDSGPALENKLVVRLGFGESRTVQQQGL